MGLLDDLFNSESGQIGLGLLAAGSARSDGAGFGQRLQEGLGAGAKWKAQQQALLEAKQMQEYRAMQMEQYKAQIEAAKQQQIQAAAKRAELPNIFSPASQGAPAMNFDQFQPQGTATGLPSQPAIAPREAGINVQRALMAGYTPDEIAKLDSLRNVGLNKVARTVKGMQGGREVEQQFDKFGRPVGQGMEQFRAPIEMATGDKKQLLDPYTRQPVASFPMGMSPSDRVSMRGQDMTDARARDLNEITRGEKKKVEDLTKGSQIASFDTMLGTLERLAQHPGLSRSVGVIGAFPTMPGTESANFKAELDTFQSQAFIPMVSQLKGMGALSDAEGKKLTAAVGALNPSMGEKAFRESIGRITAEMEAARERVSGQPTAKPAGKTPMLGQVVDGYKFKGGNPADPSSWEKQ